MPLIEAHWAKNRPFGKGPGRDEAAAQGISGPKAQLAHKMGICQTNAPKYALMGTKIPA